MLDTYSGLIDAVKIVDYNDFIFGISANGKLLTHNGGNIYTNLGSMMVDKPACPEKTEHAVFSQLSLSPWKTGIDKSGDITRYFGCMGAHIFEGVRM